MNILIYLFRKLIFFLNLTLFLWFHFLQSDPGHGALARARVPSRVAIIGSHALQFKQTNYSVYAVCRTGRLNARNMLRRPNSVAKCCIGMM